MRRTAKDVFLDALDISDAVAREAFVNEQTAGDAELRKAVNALLAAHAHSPTMTPPAVDSSQIISTSGSGRRSRKEAKEGDVIDRHFTLLRRLGEGGFGVVWLARQSAPVERDVALKLLRGAGVGMASVAARFDAERQTLARMDHPNIARVFDAGTTEAGVPYFVMEYFDGQPITDYCDSAGLSLKERLALLRDVCLAVQHAHQKGVIHRDLKPGNILVSTVDGKPEPKVIDFGIAKAVADEHDEGITPSLTLEAQVIGTPQYMSPEQATIGPKNVDTRSDVYSLGTVMYELITGSPPFDPKELRRAGLDQICRIVRERTPSKPSTRLAQPSFDSAPGTTTVRTLEASRMRRQVSGEVDWIVMRALEKEPARRYQSADALAADISRYLNHEPVEAGPPSRLYALRKFVRRRRLEVAAAAVVAAALVAVAAVSTYQKQQALAAERRADDARVLAERAAESERLAKEQAKHNEQLALKRAADAARELSKSNAIADFADTLLSGVGPSVARGRDTTLVKDLLEEATKNTDERLAQFPELGLIVRGMIGRAYFDLGDYKRAIETLKPIFDASRETPARDGSDRLRIGLLLATLHEETGQRDAAAAIFREVAEAYERLDDNTSSYALQAQSGLAQTLANQEKYEEALAVFRKTYARLVELNRGDDETAFQIRNAIASTLSKMKRTNEAIHEWEEMLAAVRRVFGNNHSATIAALTNLAFIYHETGQLDRAIEFNREVVEVARHIYEPTHPMRVPGLNNLVAVLTEAKRYDEAAKPLEEAMEILKKNPSGIGWKRAVAVYNHALQLTRAQQRWDAAVEVATAMRDLYVKQFGPDEYRTWAGEATLMTALADAKRFDDAWKCGEARLAKPAPDKLDRHYRMSMHAAMAEAALSMGRVEDARRHMELARSHAELNADGKLVGSARLHRVIAALAGPTTAPAATSQPSLRDRPTTSTATAAR